MTEASPGLVVERRGAVSTVRLDRPEPRNALTPALVGALGAAMVAAEADRDVRDVVLTGTGIRAFCAGMDLRSFAGGDRVAGADDPGVAGFMRLVQGEIATPIVGAANGAAVAGGLELLLGCDLVVASSEARFGLPEVQRGLFAAGGGTFIGQRIPLAVALEMTHRRHDRRRGAHELGSSTRWCRPTTWRTPRSPSPSASPPTARSASPPRRSPCGWGCRPPTGPGPGSRVLVMEEALGTSTGHAEMRALVERYLAGVEGDPQPKYARDEDGSVPSSDVHANRHQ